MHEAEARCLIRPVLDFFIATRFPLDPSAEEYELSLMCFQDFVKDWEPYWVREKAVWVIKTILDFEHDIGDCPDTLKEAVLAIIKHVRTSLSKRVEEERADSQTVQLDIPGPTFMALGSWSRINWNRPRKPSIE